MRHFDADVAAVGVVGSSALHFAALSGRLLAVEVRNTLETHYEHYCMCVSCPDVCLLFRRASEHIRNTLIAH